VKAVPSDAAILEETFIEFECPYCRHAVAFPDTCRATLQECPFCFQVVIVPQKGVGAGGKLAVPFKTSRLLLRRLVPADSDDLVVLMEDEESFRYIDWDPLEATEVQDWIEKDGRTRLTEKGANLCLALELLERPKMVGFLSLYYLDEGRRQVSFTMMINRDYRRQGLGSEAVFGATGLAFTDLNAHRISVVCDTRNIAAARMLGKAGMRREAECVKGEFQKGEWVSTFWYASLREEYVSTA
jgi:ribosomal-protein-alanine N-acetyltransferase